MWVTLFPACLHCLSSPVVTKSCVLRSATMVSLCCVVQAALLYYSVITVLSTHFLDDLLLNLSQKLSFTHRYVYKEHVREQFHAWIQATLRMLQ